MPWDSQPVRSREVAAGQLLDREVTALVTGSDLMALGEDTRTQVIFTGGLTVALAATGYALQRTRATPTSPSE